MITLEKLNFSKESITSVVIEKNMILEERFRYYPKYVLGFWPFKITKENYLKDTEGCDNRSYKRNFKPGELIRLPNSITCNINDGMIGEDMYPDGSHKVYRLPFITITYKRDSFGNLTRKSYPFKSGKDLDEFLDILYKNGLLTDRDLFYNNTLSELVKNIKL